EAFIVVGRNRVKAKCNQEVISKEGMLTVDLCTNKIYDATNTQFADGTYVQEQTYHKRDHLLSEHGHFYQSILESKPAVIGLKDGMNAVHLVDSTLKSMKTQAKVLVHLG